MVHEAITTKSRKNVRKKVVNVDIVFGSSSRELQALAQIPEMKLFRSGTIQVGNPFKSIYIQGRPIKSSHSESKVMNAYGCNLYSERIHQDYTINSLYYDVQNSTIIDISGFGINDIIDKKLRIPAPDKKSWHGWAQNNPSKLIRYWKFANSVDNYSPIDSNTKYFIIHELKKEQWTRIDLNCDKLLEAMFKNWRNDPEAQQREKSFREAVEHDLGKEWYEKYFGDPPVQASTLDDQISEDNGVANNMYSSRALFFVKYETPDSGSFEVPESFAPQVNIYPKPDMEQEYPIEEQNRAKERRRRSRRRSSRRRRRSRRKQTISFNLKFRENTVFHNGEAKYTKGRNVLTNLIDLAFLLLHMALVAAIIAFSGLEIKGVWDSKFIPSFSKNQFTVYNSIVIMLLVITLGTDIKLAFDLRLRTTMLDQMKRHYSRNLTFNCFVTTLAIVIQFVSVPLTNVYGYEQFYYVRIGLIAGAFVRAYLYIFTSIIMMWIKEGKGNTKRQHFLKATSFLSCLLHFVVSVLLLTTLFLFCHHSVKIQLQFQNLYYEQFYYLRGFVLVLVGWLLNNHYYYLMIIFSVIAFQGLEIMGVSIVFMTGNRLAWIWRVYSWVMMILGSISCAVIALIIYAVCEFLQPKNVPLHSSLPILYAIYTGLVHFQWIVPAMICQCQNYRQWSGEHRQKHKFSPEELATVLSPSLQKRLLAPEEEPEPEQQQQPQQEAYEMQEHRELEEIHPVV